MSNRCCAMQMCCAIEKDDFGTRGVRAMLLYTEGRYKHALVDLDFLRNKIPWHGCDNAGSFEAKYT